VDLVIITGLSGAGKSQAMGAFEDAGYFCVDNLPPRLLPALADLFALEGARVERAAVVCDVRGGVWFPELERQLQRISAVEAVRVRVLFLEASDDALLNRFRETRRRHPLALGGPLLDGIERERGALAEVRQRANVVLDTSGMNIWDLRQAVAEEMIEAQDRPRLAVTFESFGYKHGVPRDADLLVDVRFLRNPHYVPDLAPLTGLDREVAEYVEQAPGAAEFLTRLEALLDFLLAAYREEGRRHLVIGLGCTGGRHRSVALAERLAGRYAGRYVVGTAHRDIGRATAAPPLEASPEGAAASRP
jgi:UPF0042 nucleotide-binding protein